MKTKYISHSILMVLAVFSFHPGSFAQKECTLVYDFSNKELLYDGKSVTDLNKIEVCPNRMFRMKVININRYLYDVNFNRDNIIYKSEATDPFSSIFLTGGKVFEGLKNITELTKNLDEKVTEPDKTFAGDINEEPMSDSTLRVFLKSYYTLMASVIDANSLYYTKQNHGIRRTDFAQLATELMELKIAYNGKNAAEDSIIKNITDESLMKLVHYVNNISDENFGYISPPVYPSGSMLNIDLKITPNPNSLAIKYQSIPLTSDSISLSLVVRRKPVISVSTGLFLPFGIRDDHYSWQPVPDENNIVYDSSMYRISRNNKADINPGIAALVNYHYKFTGISAGVGLTMEENPRPAFLLGGLLSAGSTGRINLTLGGIIIGRRAFDCPDDTICYNTKPEAVEYKNKTAIGGFVAISYSILTPEKLR